MLSLSPAASMSAIQAFARNYAAMTQSLQRLATGQRINRAADDPAGLQAVEQLRSTLAALEAEQSNLDRADAVANTADGALSEISSLLSDANALAVASANSAGLSSEEIAANQLEMDSILASVNDIASSTSFNGQPLLDGSMTISLPNAELSIGSVSTSSLGATEVDGQDATLADAGSGGSLSLESGNAAGAQQVIAAAISEVATLRGRIGAFQANTIQSRQSAIGSGVENLSMALSAINDTDMAAETANFIIASTLAKASGAALMLALGKPLDMWA